MTRPKCILEHIEELKSETASVAADRDAWKSLATRLITAESTREHGRLVEEVRRRLGWPIATAIEVKTA